MPYVDLIHGHDCASIWYRTNTYLDNVNSFDPDKPTIAMLHPMFLDSSWMSYQIDDTRLKSSFNMIAFDMRYSGLSVCKFSPLCDSNVQAADLAYCLQYLRLPAVHILAAETLSIHCALRLAAIFPDMILSLTLVNVPPAVEPETRIHMMEEMNQMYFFAEDLDTCEHAIMEAAHLLAGPDCDSDLLDDLIGFFQRINPPTRRARTALDMFFIKNRSSIPPAVCEAITVPVLIIQSERSAIYPLECAQQLVDQLVNVKRNVVVYVVKDSAGYVTIRNSSQVNKTLHQFISRQPHARTDIKDPSLPIPERMKAALAILAEITGDKSLLKKDSINSLSFSCVSPEELETRIEMRQQFAKGAENAFSPLGSNGRPIRKYSEGRRDHWFHGEENGLSVTDPTRMPANRSRSAADAHQTDVLKVALSSLESETAKEPRTLRKANALSNPAIDKTIIKGSMARVAATSGLPLSRIIM